MPDDHPQMYVEPVQTIVDNWRRKAKEVGDDTTADYAVSSTLKICADLLQGLIDVATGVQV